MQGYAHISMPMAAGSKISMEDGVLRQDLVGSLDSSCNFKAQQYGAC